MKGLITDMFLITIAVLIICIVCGYITAAPAPLPKYCRNNTYAMSGNWILKYNDNVWHVTLFNEYEHGGDYKAIAPSGCIWNGKWYRTKWDDVFMIQERAENTTINYSTFPLRYDGTEITISNKYEECGRSNEWVGWSYQGSKVSIRRIKYK